MIAGRSAPFRSAAARSMSPPSALGAAVGSGSEAPALGSMPSVNTTSRGKSTNVGPLCGAIAARSASSTSPGISSVCPAVRAILTSGVTNGTWSISWSEPMPHRIWGARPPSTTMGELFCWAEASGLIPLVTPGPAVSAHTPGSRVTLAQPSAANAALISWRTSIRSMPSSRQPS